MRLEYQIGAAFVADIVLGDPRWLPHPVKGIALLGQTLEGALRRMVSNARAAGILTELLVLAVTGVTAWLFVAGAVRLHPVAGDVAAVVVLYTCFAGRDLASHAGRVHDALAVGDMPSARMRVGMLVGRDTHELDAPEVVRATVESVSENLVDGVTAPLFFALLGGPVGAMIYKAVNTMDSTFGYKNERYLKFGWAAARVDDVANYLPARLTVPFLVLSAAFLRLNPVQAWRICRRDGRKHPSPNSGLAEAAVAGALGVQLGGVNRYFGVASVRPHMGDPLRPLETSDILSAKRLMWVAALTFLTLLAAVRMFFVP